MRCMAPFCSHAIPSFLPVHDAFVGMIYSALTNVHSMWQAEKALPWQVCTGLVSIAHRRFALQTLHLKSFDAACMMLWQASCAVPRILEYHEAGRTWLPMYVAADALRRITPKSSPKLPVIATRGRFMSEPRRPLCCICCGCC